MRIIQFFAYFMVFTSFAQAAYNSGYTIENGWVDEMPQSSVSWFIEHLCNERGIYDSEKATADLCSCSGIHYSQIPRYYSEIPYAAQHNYGYDYYIQCLTTCKDGYYHSDYYLKCLSIPSCPLGQEFDYETESCVLYGSEELRPEEADIPKDTEEAKNDQQENPNSCLPTYRSYERDPIDSATGAQVLNHSLLTVQGAIPLNFSIYYNSFLVENSVLGRGWSTDGYATRLEEHADGKVTIHWSENQFNHFIKNPDNSYSATHISCQFDKLLKKQDGSFSYIRDNRFEYEFNQAGYLISLRNPQGQTQIFERDTTGRVTRITEPVSGVFLRYSYSGDLLESVTDSLGRVVRFSYDNQRNLVQIIDAAGQKISYSYNSFGQTLTGTNAEGVVYFKNIYDDKFKVIAQTNAHDQTAHFKYDQNDAGQIITTLKNTNGDVNVFVYSDSYRLLSHQDGNGQITHHTYNSLGQRTSTTDAKGRKTSFEYDDNGNLSKVTDPKGGITQMVYDANSNLIAVTDALGKTTRHEYDANNNRIRTTDAQGHVTRYTYNSQGQVLTVTTPDGAVITYEYTKGRPTKITDAQGNAQILEYDAAGRMISLTNSDGYTTRYEYDGVDRIIAVTDALGRTIRTTYDSRNNITTVTDANGNITRNVYDGEGNLIRQTNALNQTTHYEYDGENRLRKIVDANNNATELAYDANGRIAGIMDALGNMQYVEYDEIGNVAKEKDALHQVVTTQTYDAQNNPVSVTDALGNVAYSDYDILGRNSRVTDPLGLSTVFDYDALDRLVASTDAKQANSRQVFDSVGNRVKLVDANGHETAFNFDKNRSLIEEITAGQVKRYTYNARNLLSMVTNARNQQRRFEYDAADRITKVSDVDGVISYTYDANDNILTVTETSPSGLELNTTRREYDALNRVTKLIDPFGNVLQYAYDAVGNLSLLTYPDGKQVSYSYDAANRLVSVKDWRERVTAYVYDANGRVTQMQRPNQTAVSYEYDASGQLLRQVDAHQDGGLIRQYDFTYNPAGNIVREATQPSPQFYPFSAAKMSYGEGNQLLTYNGMEISYDADGNMISGPLGGLMSSYVFDSRNRLIQAGGSRYRFDAQNQRIAADMGSGEIRYVVNSVPALSQTLVRILPDGRQTFYVYGLGLIHEEQAGSYQAYHFDLRGSTVALSNASGQVVAQFQYFPYGELASHHVAQVDTPFLYNGRDGVMSDDNGLYHMRARFYNPDIRRFVNLDMLLGNITEGLSLNRYAYVTGDPVLFVDPFGLKKRTTPVYKWPDEVEESLKKYKSIYDFYKKSDDTLSFGEFLNSVGFRDQMIAIGLYAIKEACTGHPLCAIIGTADIKAIIETKEMLEKRAELRSGCYNDVLGKYCKIPNNCISIKH